MILIPNEVEKSARALVAILFARPGSMADIPAAMAEISRMVGAMAEGIVEVEGVLSDESVEVLQAVEERALAIVGEISADHSLLIDEFSDVLPKHFQRAITAEAIEKLRKHGIQAEMVVDDDGNRFVAVANSEAIGEDDDEDSAAPAGGIYRVH
jgi:hypothetical protein